MTEPFTGEYAEGRVSKPAVAWPSSSLRAGITSSVQQLFAEFYSPQGDGERKQEDLPSPFVDVVGVTSHGRIFVLGDEDSDEEEGPRSSSASTVGFGHEEGGAISSLSSDHPLYTCISTGELRMGEVAASTMPFLASRPTGKSIFVLCVPLTTSAQPPSCVLIASLTTDQALALRRDGLRHTAAIALSRFAKEVTSLNSLNASVKGLVDHTETLTSSLSMSQQQQRETLRHLSEVRDVQATAPAILKAVGLKEAVYRAQHEGEGLLRKFTHEQALFKCKVLLPTSIVQHCEALGGEKLLDDWASVCPETNEGSQPLQWSFLQSKMIDESLMQESEVRYNVYDAAVGDADARAVVMIPFSLHGNQALPAAALPGGKAKGMFVVIVSGTNEGVEGPGRELTEAVTTLRAAAKQYADILSWVINRQINESYLRREAVTEAQRLGEMAVEQLLSQFSDLQEAEAASLSSIWDSLTRHGRETPEEWLSGAREQLIPTVERFFGEKAKATIHAVADHEGGAAASNFHKDPRVNTAIAALVEEVKESSRPVHQVCYRERALGREEFKDEIISIPLEVFVLPISRVSSDAVEHVLVIVVPQSPGKGTLGEQSAKQLVHLLMSQYLSTLLGFGASVQTLRSNFHATQDVLRSEESAVHRRLLTIQTESEGKAQEIDRLKALQQFHSQVSAVTTINELVNIVNSAIPDITGCEAGFLWVDNSIDQAGHGASSTSLSTWCPDEKQLSSNEGLVGTALQSTSVIASDNPYEDPRYTPKERCDYDLVITNMRCIPIVSGELATAAAVLQQINVPEASLGTDGDDMEQSVALAIGAALSRIATAHQLETMLQEAAEETSRVQGLLQDSRMNLTSLQSQLVAIPSLQQELRAAKTSISALTLGKKRSEYQDAVLKAVLRICSVSVAGAKDDLNSMFAAAPRVREVSPTGLRSSSRALEQVPPTDVDRWTALQLVQASQEAIQNVKDEACRSIYELLGAESVVYYGVYTEEDSAPSSRNIIRDVAGRVLNPEIVHGAGVAHGGRMDGAVAAGGDVYIDALEEAVARRCIASRGFTYEARMLDSPTEAEREEKQEEEEEGGVREKSELPAYMPRALSTQDFGSIESDENFGQAEAKQEEGREGSRAQLPRSMATLKNSLQTLRNTGEALRSTLMRQSTALDSRTLELSDLNAEGSIDSVDFHAAKAAATPERVKRRERLPPRSTHSSVICVPILGVRNKENAALAIHNIRKLRASEEQHMAEGDHAEPVGSLVDVVGVVLVKGNIAEGKQRQCLEALRILASAASSALGASDGWHSLLTSVERYDDAATRFEELLAFQEEALAGTLSRISCCPVKLIPMKMCVPPDGAQTENQLISELASSRGQKTSIQGQLQVCISQRLSLIHNSTVVLSTASESGNKRTAFSSGHAGRNRGGPGP